MTKVSEVRAREVLDSRGDPTIEVDVFCGPRVPGRAIVPSGASTGRHEAVELRDADPKRYDGRGVLTAIENVRSKIAPRLIGHDVLDQVGIDRQLIELDGTPNKSNLGANAVLGVSLACAHAAASALNEPLYAYLGRLWTALPSAIPANANGPDSAPIQNQKLRLKNRSLPLPMVNMISGGLHAGGNLDFQDFLIMPVGATSYSQALLWIVRVYRTLRRVLAAHGLESALVGDEGGFGPRLDNNRAAVELIVESIYAAQLEPGRDVAIAIDVASSHFFVDGHYRLTAAEQKSLSAAELVEQLAGWTDRYPVISIEDGCAEDDWDGWRILTDRLRGHTQLIGDDLFATNLNRLRAGIKNGVANAVLVKPNQIGSLTETLEVIALAQSSGYRTIVSARSGETEDVTIAHLAVATGAGQIKIGSVARSERLAKYNELLRIEQELGERITLANEFRLRSGSGRAS